MPIEDADKFITNFHHLQVMRQWAAYTAASMYTARCLNNYGPPGGSPWPNVTLPDFPDQMRGALVLAHAITVEFSPLFVNNQTTRKQWEEYAVDNEAMIMHVPSWAMVAHGGGHDMEEGEHGGGHDMTMDVDGASAGHDMGASSEHDGSGEHGAMVEHDMGETKQMQDNAPSHNTGDMMKMEMDHDAMNGDMDPTMVEAIEIATSDEVLSSAQDRRRLRGRILHGHDGASNSNHAMEHDVGASGHDMDSVGDGHEHGNGHVEHPRRPIEEGIYTMGGPGIMVDEAADESEVPLLVPAWQIFPLVGNEGKVLYNEYSDRHRRRAIDTILTTKRAALTEVLYGYADHHHFYKDPSSIMMYPVFDSFDSEDTVVGFVSFTFSWISTFWNILPENVKGIIAVIETSTGQKTSFRVNGKLVCRTFCVSGYGLLESIFLSTFLASLISQLPFRHDRALISEKVTFMTPSMRI